MVSIPLTVSKLWLVCKLKRRRSPMLLACPNCATTYDVKPIVIGDDGRSLRCARCQIVWFATKSQELIVPEPVGEAALATDTPSAFARDHVDSAPSLAQFEPAALEKTTTE